MKYEDVRRYAELMKEFGLTSIEITDEGSTLKLETGTAAPAAAASASQATQTSDQPAAETAVSQEPASDGHLSVRSPMVGVFYRAPAENAAPYVKVGDTIKKGTVIGLIEAMKLMNEIVSDCDGVVEEIIAENGQTVDFGFELIRLRKI